MKPDGLTFIQAATHDTIFFDLEKACEYIISPPAEAEEDIPAAFVIFALVIQLSESSSNIEGWQLSRLYEALFMAGGGPRIGLDDASSLATRIERFKFQAEDQLENGDLSDARHEDWLDHLTLSFVPTFAKYEQRAPVLAKFREKMLEYVGPQASVDHVVEVLAAVC